MTTFLEPGGDATFDFSLWGSVTGSPTIVSDFVRGNHLRSIRYAPSVSSRTNGLSNCVADAGTRIYFGFYIAAFPTGGTAAPFLQIYGASNVIYLTLTNAGVLRATSNGTTQLGNDGPTLSISQFYRITFTQVITSTSVNRFEILVNGIPAISLTNVTLPNIGSTNFQFGNINNVASFDFRISDVYVDNSSSLTDPGNIWVTAKRPNANGLTNGFLVQIGSGGSGYGSGHSPQINERALSTTNGWSTTLLGTTEEYTIEATSAGDIDISRAEIIDYMGWIDAGASGSVTGSIIVGGAVSNVSLTTTITTFTAFAGSKTYPTGGTDIGMISSGSVGTDSLYECGVVVAYIPLAQTRSPYPNHL